jgi:predicted GIY-YIG superfamily endonuclease
VSALEELPVLQALGSAEEYSFDHWGAVRVPRESAGVYTIWRAPDLVYVGMTGNLWERLNAHASGRRSGDQFCVYVCDRFLVPALTASQQAAVGRGELSLDKLTREYVRGQLTYRYVTCPNVAEARALERAVRMGELAAGRPYLNPLGTALQALPPIGVAREGGDRPRAGPQQHDRGPLLGQWPG